MISERTIAAGNVSWQQFTDTMTVERDGFVKVSIGNASNTVFTGFDELVITHQRNEEAMIVQENHYEPFGMTLQGLDFMHQAQVGKENNFLFNEMEKEDALNLEMYDYGARGYDPQLGRFHQVDPHADRYRDWSPYTYCVNNPINVIDPTGMDTVRVGKDGMAEATLPEVTIISDDDTSDSSDQQTTSDAANKTDNTTSAAASEKPLELRINIPTIQKFGEDWGVGNTSYVFPIAGGGYAGTGASTIGSLGAINAFLLTIVALIPGDTPIKYSKKGKQNIWPDQYGYPPNVKDVDWSKGDSELADEISSRYGDTQVGPDTPNNITKKWFRDKRPSKKKK